MHGCLGSVTVVFWLLGYRALGYFSFYQSFVGTLDGE